MAFNAQLGNPDRAECAYSFKVVKKLIGQLEVRSSLLSDKSHEIQEHHALLVSLHELDRYLEKLESATVIFNPRGLNPLALSRRDVEGLPEQLLEQLINVPEDDDLESFIVEIINDCGGTLVLDHLLIQLYQRTGEVHQRQSIVSKLYRMTKKEDDLLDR